MIKKNPFIPGVSQSRIETSPATEAGTCTAFSALADKGSDWTAASCTSLTGGGTTIGTGTCETTNQTHRQLKPERNHVD